MIKKQSKTFEARVKVKKRLYPKGIIEESIFWGIYSCELIKSDESIQLNDWGNFTVKGTSTELLEGKEYMVILGEIEKNPKGDSYPLINVKGEKLTSAKSQREFLQSVVTTKQFETIMRAYPNEKILDFIMDDKMDVSKLKGIGKSHLEGIKAKIRDKRELGSLINQLSPLGVTMNSIETIAKHFGNPITAVKKINESLYNLCSIKGFGFKKVDKYAMTSGESPTSIHRINACIHYVLNQESNQGHSWIGVEELYKKANDMLNIELIHIIEFIDELDTEIDEDLYNIQLENIHDDEEDTRPYIDYNKILNINGKITLMSHYLDEIHTYQHLKRINDNYTSLNTSSISVGIKKAEDELNIVYTEEQRLAITEAINNGIYVLNGSAGTGKTTILKGIVSICEELGLIYSACALSGKASQVLSSKGIKASTIHRLLGFRGQNFDYDEHTKLPYDVVILDEASMVNASLWKSLTQAIENGSKLIIVGDSGQLSGIGHGDIMRDLLDSNYFSGRELKQIHRQAEDSGIIELAHKVRNGEQLTGYNYEVIESYGKNKDITLFTYNDRESVISATKSIINNQIEKINKLPHYEREKAILDFQVLVANKTSGNISTFELNKHIQSIYNPSSEGDKYVISGKTHFKVNDKVIVSGNSYEIKVYDVLDDYLQEINQDDETDEWLLEGLSEDEIQQMNTPKDTTVTDLFNGTIGIIEYVDEKNNALLIRFEGINGLILINDDNLDKLDLAYAITIHRSQGLSIKNVMIAIDFTSFMLLSKQLVYTAITRSSNKCVLVAESGALNKAIKIDASGIRRTFMKYLLMDESSLSINNK